MTEQPTTSPWEAVDKLEALSEQPKPLKRGFLGLNANNIKLEQSLKQSSSLETIDSFATSGAEQPNTELLIVKTIQGLMTVVNDNLVKLSEISEDMECKALVLKALEDIDLFEKTTLYELQKVVE